MLATFYEELHKSRGRRLPHQVHGHSGRTISAFSHEELLDALKGLRRGKAKDTSGITAEMSKVDCAALHTAILDLFNDVVSIGNTPPKQWYNTRLVVIFKKGDATSPSNYRPIAILPILYKLFSRMLCKRIQVDIINNQSVDQAAYRKGYSTVDHLLCTTLLMERAAEWNVEMWFGLVDFEKAFDTVEHEMLWDALSTQGVGNNYVWLLRALYDGQSATVVSSTESRRFELQRGVKQGDPISSLLFLAVMEAIFRPLKARWAQLNRRRTSQYYGIVVDTPDDPLTNLRFADDVLLVAVCRADVAKMVRDLSHESAKYGLQLHMGKTAIITNAHSNRPAFLKCGEHDITVKATDAPENT